VIVILTGFIYVVGIVGKGIKQDVTHKTPGAENMVKPYPI